MYICLPVYPPCAFKIVQPCGTLARIILDRLGFVVIICNSTFLFWILIVSITIVHKSI